MSGASLKEQIEQERADLRARFGDFYDRLARLLFEEDPIGINFEDNEDEYDPEVRTILPRLAACRSSNDVLGVVHEEFGRWFDPETAGPSSRYERIAARISAEFTELLGRRA